MGYKYIHSKNFNKTRLLEVLSLDDTVYDKKYTGTYESVSKRYKSNEEMFIFALDEADKLCGYICFFPISESLKEKIENGEKMFDDNIESTDVLQYDKGKVNNIFIISVAVFPQYIGKGIGFNLVKEMFDFFNSLSNMGYAIGKIYASATSKYGEKLLSKYNFEIMKQYEDNNYLMAYEFISYKNMDLYLFFPIKIDDNIVIQSNVADDYQMHFINLLQTTSQLEINSLMHKRLNRNFIGKINFEPEDDYGNMMSTKFLSANLYSSSYRDIGVVIVEFPSISFDPTYILDQASSETLKVNLDGNTMIFTAYLQALGFTVLGNCTHLLVSDKKQSPYYRKFVLFAEAYFNRIGSKIVSRSACNDAELNIAQYEFADIYASPVGISFEINPLLPSSTYEDRLKKSILMIFINEVLSLEIASLKLAQNLMTKEFDNSPKPSLDIIENLIDKFGKYIVLFEYNCKYPLAKNLTDLVAEKFGIPKMQKQYKHNIELLNKIVSIRSEKLNKEFSKKQDALFKIISVFTLLISINNVIALFTGMDFSNNGNLIRFIISLIIWVGAVIYLLALWFKRLNKRKTKK